MIPEDKIEEIKNANDIVEVVGGYLSLKRAGRNFKANCPFHQEKTPSFVVSPDKQIYHCFGCGEGGNVFTFVQKEEGMNFIESVKYLAKRANITIEDSYSNPQRAGEKDKLIEMNKVAMGFFAENLPKSQIAVEYAAKRNISREVVEEFNLGYAPSGNQLYRRLKEKNYEDAIIEKSGLCQARGSEFMDSFRDRLMFPILNIFGEPIAFGGRVLDNSLPKYINLKETTAYIKSRNLYNLNNARKYKEEFIVIVEGYMDAIALYKNGIRNVVATLGTALTDGQAALLKRYVQKAVIMYDSDDAGVSGASRGGEILFSNGIDTRIASLGEFKDPDEIAEKIGPQGLSDRIKDALSFIGFKAGFLKKQGDIKNPYYKEKAVREMAAILGNTDNLVVRNDAVRLISEELNVPMDIINKYIGREDSGAVTADENESPLKIKGTELAEKQLLCSVLRSFSRNDEDLVLDHFKSKRKLTGVEYADFKNEFYKNVLSRIEGYSDAGEKHVLDRVQLDYVEDPVATRLIAGLLAEEREEKPDKATEMDLRVISDCLIKLRREKCELKLKDLHEKILEAEKLKDMEKMNLLLKEKSEVQKVIKQRGDDFE